MSGGTQPGALVDGLRRGPEGAIAFGLGLTAFLLYARTLAPGVLDGDSGEWQYVIPILGVPHSTGYPLYVLTAKLLTLLPVGSVALRVNLYSALAAAGAVSLFYLLARQLKVQRGAAVLASALFAVAPSLWSSAVQAEVYALNTLLGLAALWFAWRWYGARRARDLLLLAFIFGLALAHHRVMAFLAPGMFLLLLLTRRSLSLRTLFLAALLVLLPQTLYLNIPLRAQQYINRQDPRNWELYQREDAILNGTVSAYYRNTPDGFFNLVTALDNRNKLGFQEEDPQNTLPARIERSKNLLVAQFGEIGLSLAIVGAALWWRRDRMQAVVLWGAVAGVAGVGLFLRGDSTQFYFSLVYAVLGLCVAVALDTGLRWVEAFHREPDSLSGKEPRPSASPSLPFAENKNSGLAALPRPTLGSGLAFALFALLPYSRLVVNFDSLDQSHNSSYSEFAQTVLADHLGPNAVLVAPWEIATPIRYFQFVEKRRQDLLVIHDVPSHPKFFEILDNARKQNRPFYWVEFTPEDRLAPGPRYVQALPLPLRDPVAPQFALDVKMTEGITLVGYSLTPNLPQPGSMTRVEFLYRTDAPTKSEFGAELSMADLSGHEWGDYARPPVSQYYPPSFWRQGEYFREVWFWTLPLEAPAGLYTAELSWFNRSEGNVEKRAEIAPFEVGPVSSQAPPPNVLKAEIGDGIDLLGYDVAGRNAEAHAPIRAGDTLHVSLYWSANRALSESYTIFVHLLDARGRIRAQQDVRPLGGLYPTDRWPPGRTMRDEYALALPANLDPGDYTLEIGMYLRPDARLPVKTAQGVSDRVILPDSIHIIGNR